MAMYKVIMHYSDGSSEELDDVFASESAANSHGMYMCDCYRQGFEDLHMSNPGDYPAEAEGSADYEVVELD